MPEAITLKFIKNREKYF